MSRGSKDRALWLPLAALVFELHVVFLANCVFGLHLPIDLAPPRPTSKTLHPYRGFPDTVSVFNFEHPMPFSIAESVRWHALRRFRVDRDWRESRTRYGPLRHVEHVHTVDMLGGITRVGEYYTRIDLGGQKVRVQIDTGSSTLAVPAAECVRCRPSDLRYNMKISRTGNARWISCANSLCAPDKCTMHNCSRCSSTDACCAEENPTACGFALKYGDGSFARGALAIDDMTWGDNLTAPVVFGAILYDSVGFERNLVDGILGLAYESLACNPTCVEPPFQQMVKAGVVKDKFAICMTLQGGKLLLGDLDQSLAKSEVKYIPFALPKIPRYYTVNMTNTVTIGDRDLALPNLQHAVIDSGTTLIAVSKKTFELMLLHLMQHYCHIPNLCGMKTWFLPTACVHLSDDILSQMPSFTFHLGPRGEFPLVLQPDDYMIKDSKNGLDLRCVGFMALPQLQPGTDIIFGNTIMLRYLTVYDRENKRMGFAESAGTCGDPPECSSYTQCVECAADSKCAYDFNARACLAREHAGWHIFPFPVCTGSGCVCKFGPQTYLLYGLAAGFLTCVGAALVGFVFVTLYNYTRKSRQQRSFGRMDEGTENDNSEPAPLVANER